MKTKKWFQLFLKGASLGFGIVPGVDAGTMAIIVGIYDELIASFADLRKNFKESAKWLLPVCLGAVVCAFALMLPVKLGFEYFPFALTALFAGFLIGSLPFITRELKAGKPSSVDISLMIAGFIVAVGIGILSIVSLLVWKVDLTVYFENRVWWVYLVVIGVGFIVAIACLLPGISGAVILFICGLYQPTISLFVGDAAIWKGSSYMLWTGLGLVFCLLIGLAAGFFSVSKMMRRLLIVNRYGTFSGVFGFVLGSIVAMFLNKDIWNAYQTTPWWEYLLGGVLLVGTAIGTYLVSKTIEKKEQQKLLKSEVGATSEKR